MAVRFVIIGGGPAGVQAATYAARLGADVTMVERDVVGGAANLWDCIPSKAMIATGGVMSLTRRAEGMGLSPLAATLDFDLAGRRITGSGGHHRAARTSICWPARECGSSMPPDGSRARMKWWPRRRRPRGAGGRRRAPVDRQPAPHPRLGRARRRAAADHPPGLSAAGAAVAPGRDRVGRDRRRVRAHVPVLRLGGDAHRQPPAGAAAEGRRGGGRARGRSSPAA